MTLSIPVLNYHGIQSRPGEYGWETGEKVYVLPLPSFQEQLQILARKSKSLVCGDLKNAEARGVLLTFDDGHVSHFEYARPALKAAGFSGVFFVSAGLVGEKDFMNAGQLREMIREGFEIGSHGYHHVPLPGLSLEQLNVEMRDSKKRLEDLLGSEVRSFSIPRGFYHSRIRSAAEEAGYHYLFTSHFGLQAAGGDLLYIRRMAVTADTTSKQLEAWIDGALGMKLWVEEAKEKTRQLIGPSGYEKMALIKARLRTMTRKG